MKHFKIASNIFLSGLLFLGCTDEFDMEFPTRQPTYQGTINLKQVTLNPTEQRLKGEWYLRSMSTKTVCITIVSSTGKKQLIFGVC
jgi:hypothetical protein